MEDIQNIEDDDSRHSMNDVFAKDDAVRAGCGCLLGIAVVIGSILLAFLRK